jgi:hypothetical protein
LAISVSRSSDTARLYLERVDAATWLVTGVLASGMQYDGDIGRLLGRRLAPACVLEWADGLRTSGDLVAVPSRAGGAGRR